MEPIKAWAVTTRGRMQVWPDGQLGIWKDKPGKDDVARDDKVVQVFIMEIPKYGPAILKAFKGGLSRGAIAKRFRVPLEAVDRILRHSVKPGGPR